MHAQRQESECKCADYCNVMCLHGIMKNCSAAMTTRWRHRSVMTVRRRRITLAEWIYNHVTSQQQLCHIYDFLDDNKWFWDVRILAGHGLNVLDCIHAFSARRPPQLIAYLLDFIYVSIISELHSVIFDLSIHLCSILLTARFQLIHECKIITTSFIHHRFWFLNHSHSINNNTINNWFGLYRKYILFQMSLILHSNLIVS